MRVLIVCFPESPHAQGWIDLFRDEQEFDVRVFAHNFVSMDDYLPQPWTKPTYVLERPKTPRDKSLLISPFPDARWSRFVAKRVLHRWQFVERYFRRVIEKWKPDIVHGLSMPSSYFAWSALKKLRGGRPRFIVSSWGSDINLGKDDPGDQVKFSEMLRNCDGFFADCARDLRNAVGLGLPEKLLAFDFAIPVNGGIDVESGGDAYPVEERKIILIPKAVEAFANKTLAALEALNSLRDKLHGYEIHLLVASEDVKKHLSLLPEEFRKRCILHPQLPHDEVMNLMKRARLMISPSVTDGTPVSMLEAMSVGALPIMSPLESIKEWIEDGTNGLLGRALHPNELTKAIEAGLSDDDFFRSAASINREIISKRANRRTIKTQVLKFYKSLNDN